MSRHVLQGRIGAGGMAEVFLAHQISVEKFKRPVAIKRILPAVWQDERAARLFIAEARTAASLSHPNIVSILDFDRDEGSLFLVMELVEGADLRRLLHETRATGFEPELAAYIIAEVLEGLAYAHEKDGGGLIHRDVSPHNVLVSRTGAIKLSDFGIAKVKEASDLSQSGTVRGKLAYMAPEQASAEELDARADLFATGVMLYELLTGRRPFDGATEKETLVRLLQNRRPPLRDLREGIPAELDGICERLLAHRKEDRYASARDALADLRAWSGLPRDGRDRVARLVDCLPERPPAPVLAEGSPLEIGTASAPQATTAARPRSTRWLPLLGVLALLSVTAALVVWLVPGLAPSSRPLGSAASSRAPGEAPSAHPEASTTAEVPETVRTRAGHAGEETPPELTPVETATANEPPADAAPPAARPSNRRKAKPDRGAEPRPGKRRKRLPWEVDETPPDDITVGE